MDELAARFGSIDIYLFDQLLRGNIRPGMAILDAGCGQGRNLAHFLREGYDVRGCDADAGAIAALQRQVPGDRFRVEAVEASSFPAASADVVLSIAVLHFAGDPGHFEAMLWGTWRLLKSGGLFFCRLATAIGMDGRCQPLGSGRYRLPDGTDRFLVDEARLMALTAELGGTLVDPLKTTLVQGLRAMTTWVVRKS
jgi:SAM-dependent methyltransferase